MKVWLKRCIVRAAARYDYELTKKIPFDAEMRALGRDWPGFGYTMIGLRRLDHLQECVEDVIRRRVPGDLMEAGVWRGGAGILMNAVLRRLDETDRAVWLADSFEGLPKPDESRYPADAGFDLSGLGYLMVSVEEVRANFERFGLLDDNVRFLKGWFRDTLASAPVERLASDLATDVLARIPFDRDLARASDAGRVFLAGEGLCSAAGRALGALAEAVAAYRMPGPDGECW